MTTQVYSSDYLRALPIKRRKEYMSVYIKDYIHSILDAAGRGKTSILLEQKQETSIILRTNIQLGMTIPTTDELCEALLEQFPDCKIEYKEEWIETIPGKKILKKGLNVDWSCPSVQRQNLPQLY